MKKVALTQRALYEEVADLLRQRIFAHELLPGSWIDESAIAEEFGISRTPLREALKVLAAEGLVTMKVRRGAYVTEVTQEDIAQVYHLLSLLESDAARTVAAHISDAQLQELEHLHHQLGQHCEDTERFFELNERFHFRLLEMSGNRWRIQMINDLRKIMKLSRHHSLRKQGRVQAALREHALILDSLQRRDPEAAAQAMQAHFQQGLAAASAVAER